MEDHPPGYNPIRHRCEAQGCYLTECNPRTEWFADIFPGLISFSDMDKIVEVAGRGLVFDWKRTGGRLVTAQRIMWARLTRGGMLTVIGVNFASVKDMDVREYIICWNGKWQQEWAPATIIDLHKKISGWKDWALANPVFSVVVNSSIKERVLHEGRSASG